MCHVYTRRRLGKPMKINRAFEFFLFRNYFSRIDNDIEYVCVYNSDNRQDSTNEITEQELDSSANRLNPKRYSKNRKGFTGFFPPEEIVGECFYSSSS